MSGLAPAPLRGVPMGEDRARRPHPMNVQTEWDKLTFGVELCVPLPEAAKPGSEPVVVEKLDLGI